MNNTDKMFCNLNGIILGSILVFVTEQYFNNIAFDIIAALIGNVIGVIITAIAIFKINEKISKKYKYKDGMKDEDTYR